MTRGDGAETETTERGAGVGPETEGETGAGTGEIGTDTGETGAGTGAGGTGAETGGTETGRGTAENTTSHGDWRQDFILDWT